MGFVKKFKRYFAGSRTTSPQGDRREQGIVRQLPRRSKQFFIYVRLRDQYRGAHRDLDDC